MKKISAKEKIIDAAKQIMVTRGYKATTVDEIIQLAGVAKGSFYHAFKSKEELALAALDDYKEKGWLMVTAGDYLEIEDPVKKALTFVRFLEKQSSVLWKHGCLLGSVAVEIADAYPILLSRIDKLFGEYENGMALIFNQALRKKGVRNVTGRELGRHLMVVIEGGIISAKSHNEPKYLADSIAHFHRYLECILKQK